MHKKKGEVVGMHLKNLGEVVEMIRNEEDSGDQSIIECGIGDQYNNRRCIGDCQTTECDALGIAKKLGKAVGIKVGLSLIFSDRVARGGGINEISFS